MCLGVKGGYTERGGSARRGFVTKAKAHGWESTNPGYSVQRWRWQRHNTPHHVPKSSPEDASIRALDWLP